MEPQYGELGGKPTIKKHSAHAWGKGTYYKINDTINLVIIIMGYWQVHVVSGRLAPNSISPKPVSPQPEVD